MTVGPREHDPRPAFPGDDEYAVLDLGNVWPLLGLVCFLGALGARFLVELVPRDLLGWPWRLLLPGLSVPVLSLLGLIFGLVGLRRAEGRGLAKVAVLVNAVGLVVGLLAIWVFFAILPG